MLKGISGLLSPELLKILMEMGHGDELLLADGNYPKFGHPAIVARADGHGIPALLDAILKYFPLDSYSDHPVIFMEVVPGDPYLPNIWETYRELIARHEEGGARDKAIGKQEFYERASKAYAVVATSESALYANIILVKGVVK